MTQLSPTRSLVSVLRLARIDLTHRATVRLDRGRRPRATRGEDGQRQQD
jgi:hypothetical protein